MKSRRNDRQSTTHTCIQSNRNFNWVQVDYRAFALTGGKRMPLASMRLDVVSCHQQVWPLPNDVRKMPSAFSFTSGRPFPGYLTPKWITKVAFSGDHHPYVPGKVVRVALQVGNGTGLFPLSTIILPVMAISNVFIRNMTAMSGRYLSGRTRRKKSFQSVVNHFFWIMESQHHVALHEESPNQVHYRIPPGLGS